MLQASGDGPADAAVRTGVIVLAQEERERAELLRVRGVGVAVCPLVLQDLGERLSLAVGLRTVRPRPL